MLRAAVLALLLSLSLESAEPDRLMDLVGEMLQSTLTGDQAAVGRLKAAVLEELKKPHPKAAFAWNQVAVYLQTQGDYAGAERAYLRGIRLVENGDSAGELEFLLLNLAHLYLETDRDPAHAEALARRALKKAIEVQGTASPDRAYFLCILGAARQRQGDRKGARRFYREAFDLAGNSSPAGRIQQGTILVNLAVLSVREKQWIQARDFLLQSIALAEPLLGPLHQDLIRVYLNLARVYLQLKQWTDAHACAAKAREIAEARLREDHPLMVAILESTAVTLRKTGRVPEARDLERRAKAIAKAQPKDSALQAPIDIADLKRPAVFQIVTY